MVDRLDQLDIGILFVVGGDGTLRGAMKLVDEIGRRDLLISVVGIPKTIDNDIHFIDRSFGFESAYSAAVDVIRGAHVEATGANNGIAVVKLMGRHSGFIACHAAIASTDVDAVLIPEVPASPRRRRRAPPLPRAAAREGRARGDRGGRGRRSGSLRRERRPRRASRRRRTRAETYGSAISGSCSAIASSTTFASDAWMSRSSTWTRAITSAACPPCRTTASTAGTWLATRCTRRWRAIPRC